MSVPQLIQMEPEDKILTRAILGSASERAEVDEFFASHTNLKKNRTAKSLLLNFVRTYQPRGVAALLPEHEEAPR